MNSKRKFDIAVATSMLVLTSPLILTAMFAMAVDTRSSPLFKQQRVGQNQELFTIYKIKSMRDQSKSGKKLSDKERTSRLGILLRKSKIDEFLQFFNILKGNMSVVGPRPRCALDTTLVEDKKRHSVKPGMTGYAQITLEKDSDFQKIITADHKYVEKSNFLFDLAICWHTPRHILDLAKQQHFQGLVDTPKPKAPVTPQ